MPFRALGCGAAPPGTSVHWPAKVAVALRKIAKENVTERIELFIGG